jgi:hypothetical protein
MLYLVKIKVVLGIINKKTYLFGYLESLVLVKEFGFMLSKLAVTTFDNVT